MIESKINAPFFGDCFMTHSRTLLHVIAMVQFGVYSFCVSFSSKESPTVNSPKFHYHWQHIPLLLDAHAKCKTQHTHYTNLVSP